MNTRFCPGCKKHKPYSAYYESQRITLCKECHVKQQQKKRLSDAEMARIVDSYDGPVFYGDYSKEEGEK